MGDQSSNKRPRATCCSSGAICCLAIAFVGLFVVAGIIRVMFAKTHAMPVPPPDETRVGFRVNVAHAKYFAGRLREDKKLQAHLRRAVAQAQGVDEASLGMPIVTIEGSHQHDVSDPASSIHASESAGDVAGDVHIEFQEPMSRHLGRSKSVESSQAALQNLGRAVQAEFPSEVRSAKPTVVSDLTARCFINVTMGSTLCQGLLSTALHVEQDMIQRLIMRELPKWVSNVSVGYELNEVVLQPTVRISTEELRAAFGSEPEHRLRCTFEKWVGSSMTKATDLFGKYSGGRCVDKAGAVHCHAVQGPGSSGERATPCRTSDVLPTHMSFQPI